MPKKDKLRALLSKQERKVPDAVRLKEMNEVRNYNRNQFQKVFDFEKQQVEREKESIQPTSAKDVGSAFKLQVYILKLNQVLQLKQETYTSLTNALVNPDGQPGDVQRLTGPGKAEAALATTFFSKAELFAAFNEMMAFIQTFMPEMLTNERQKVQVYSAYLTPLKDLIITIQGLYPTFFATFNAQGRVIPDEGTNKRKVFEQIRTQCMAMYSLLGTMAEFLHDENLRPITASDVADYSKQFNAAKIFTLNPLAPPGVSVQSQIDAQARQTAAAQAALQAQQAARQQQQAALAQQVGERAQMGAQTQQGIQDVAAAQALAGSYNERKGFNLARRFRQQGFQPSIQPIPVAQAVQSFQQQRTAQGVPDAQAMSAAFFGSMLPQGQRLPNLFNVIRYLGNTDYSESSIRQALNRYKRDNPQYATRRGPVAPIRPPVIPQQQQQGAPAGPAYATQPAAVLTQPYLDAILAYERQAQAAGQQLNIQDAFAALPQALQQEQIDAHGDEQNAIQDGLQPMIDVIAGQRNAFAQANGVGADTLVGQGLPELKKFVDKKGMFPSKMNPKHVAHFMKIGVQPDIIFKLMKKHGIRDGALAEELEGSGIFDDIVHYGSKAFDSVKSGAKDLWKGVKDNVKDALPSMSDVRRGIDKVVPDQYKKHLPDSLQTSVLDKAKNFFGFGASEAGGIPDRHREPFSAPNLDKYGYRQGAAERMRIMPVDMELTSGLGRLRGGDQLRDTDVEVMRRQDHHDVDVDVPVAHDQPMHGYGVDGDEDDAMQGGLKQRLMGMPLAMFAPRGGQHKNFVKMFSGGELDPYADRFEGGAEGFYEEEEKPHDHDEDPTPFRVRNENHAVNTGKLKKVTYKD